MSQFFVMVAIILISIIVMDNSAVWLCYKQKLR